MDHLDHIAKIIAQLEVPCDNLSANIRQLEVDRCLVVEAIKKMKRELSLAGYELDKDEIDAAVEICHGRAI